MDDKAVIAQMVNLASAPPVDHVDAEAPGPSEAQISVPIWQDEELEDFSQRPSSSECDPWPPHHSPASPFPPPPPKEHTTAYNFYEYDYPYDDLGAIVEHDVGPSAPPFEESCSNVPVFDIVPSAPPLAEDDLDVPVSDCDGEAPGSNAAQRHDRENDSMHSREQQHSYTLDPNLSVPNSGTALPSYHA